MFRFQVIQAFCIFNHLMIYQICEIMMSTWGKLLEYMFEYIFWTKAH